MVMPILISAVTGAVALPAMFFSLLYLREHQLVPIITPLIGGVTGAAVAYLASRTNPQTKKGPEVTPEA